MKASLRKLFKSKFVRSVAVVATGAAGAQAITMGFAPLVTRLYGPESIGMLGTFTAILAIVTPIAALTFPIAVVLPKSDTDARNIARLSVIIALIVSAIFAAVFAIGGRWIAHILNLEAVADFLMLIPIAMLFTALKDTFTQWLIRKQQFKITARVAVTQSLIVNSGKVGAGFLHPAGAVLIAITVVGQALLALQLLIGIRRGTEAQARSDESTGTLRQLAKRHRDFPIYRAPQVMLNAISQSLPVLMLASFFGPAAAGFYSIGITVLGVPSTLIGTAVGDVFYPRIAEAENKQEKLYGLVLKATSALALVGLLPFSIIIILGPQIFAFAFGSEWFRAGEYARWVALLMFVIFINSPTNKVIPVLRIQGLYLWMTIGALAVRSAALAIGYLVYSSDYVAVAAFAVSGAVIYILQIAIVLILCKRVDGRRLPAS